MANDNTIQRTRKEITSAKETLKSAAGSVRPGTRKSLMTGGLQTLPQRREKKGVRKEISKATGEVKRQATSFEKQVARKKPSQAKPEFLKEAFTEAKSNISKNIKELKEDIKDSKEDIKKYGERERSAKRDKVKERYDERQEKEEDELDVLQSKLKAYKRSLKAPKEKVVKNWFAGIIENKAENAAIEEKNRIARQKYRKSLGFNSQTEFIKSKPILEKLRRGDATIEEIKNLPKDVREKTGLNKGIEKAKKEQKQKLKDKGLVEIGDTGNFFDPKKFEATENYLRGTISKKILERRGIEFSPKEGTLTSTKNDKIKAPVKEKKFSDKLPDETIGSLIYRKTPFFGGTSLLSAIGGEKFAPRQPIRTLKDVDKTFVREFKQAERGPIKGILNLGETGSDLIRTGVQKTFAAGRPKITAPSFGTKIDKESKIGGDLNPAEEVNLKVSLIRNDFNNEKISKNEAIDKIKKLKNSQIFEKAKRIYAPETFGESGAKGFLATAVPVIGAPVIISDLLQLNPKKVVEGFEERPKTSSLLLASGVAGGIAGGAAGGALKAGLKSRSSVSAADDIDVRVLGKANEKQVLNVLDDSNLQISTKGGRITSTNTYNVKIPVTKGNNLNLQIVEFVKNGVKRYYGKTTKDGKIISTVDGKSIVGSGDDGLRKVITRFIEQKGKKGKSVSVSEVLERIKLKDYARTSTFTSKTLSSGEARLARKFDLQNLTPEQLRLLLRRELFTPEEAIKRKNRPFTDAEFKAALKLSKSDILENVKLVKGKLTQLSTRYGENTLNRNILKLKGKTIGRARIKPLIKKDLTTTLKTNKLGAPKGKGFRTGFEAFSPTKILINKIRKTRTPKKTKTPLSKTFGESQLIKQVSRSKTKTQPRTNLIKTDTTPGTVGALGRVIQKGAQKAFVKTKTGVGAVSGLISGAATGIISGTRSAQATKTETAQKAAAQQKSKIKTQQIDLIKTSQKPALKEGQVSRIDTKTAQTTTTDLKTNLRTAQATVTPTITLTKKTTTAGAPILGTSSKLISGKKINLPGVKKSNSYYPEVKEGGKYKRVSRKPMKLKDALARASFATDNTTSATFRLRPSNKKKDLGKVKNKNHFIKNRNKFRDYKIEKGKRKQLKNKFIERRGISRIDTPGEKKQLKLARLIKQKGWLKKKKK